MKTKEVFVRVHKTLPGCCRRSLLEFAAWDRYAGGGEPGDKIQCGCGNWLVFDLPGWRIAESSVRTVEEPA